VHSPLDIPAWVVADNAWAVGEGMSICDLSECESNTVGGGFGVDHPPPPSTEVE